MFVICDEQQRVRARAQKATPQGAEEEKPKSNKARFRHSLVDATCGLFPTRQPHANNMRLGL